MRPGEGLKQYMMPPDSHMRELIHHCMWLVSGAVIHDGGVVYPASEEAMQHIENWLVEHKYLEDETDIPAPEL